MPRAFRSASARGSSCFCTLTGGLPRRHFWAVGEKRRALREPVGLAHRGPLGDVRFDAVQHRSMSLRRIGGRRVPSAWMRRSRRNSGPEYVVGVHSENVSVEAGPVTRADHAPSPSTFKLGIDAHDD